ncbi:MULTISPECIES: MBL fold metallo-hydrolase [Ramlibacter]|uniref:MBL fold metallo-hydrolase n=1 Tax=Ramlibacter aquaticus TaxID=2780094 RepID=A0ABR9SBZ5_9BURK|nr:MULTISPECIES: MBL fold metallo-hydrolase [Ramlibacter]MBE7939379.1 MBL fold metallo-hydrolase [Ramlibacter aquaticus]
MQLQFLGATDTVTGSKYLLRHGDRHLLVDCGLFQGYKTLRLRNWADLPVPPTSIDAVVLTHAHIDHSGYLPLLVREGFTGPVYCTPATHDLCRIMLPDSGYLQEEEAEYLNRHHASKHEPALPLYTRDDALRSLHHFRPVAPGAAFEPLPGLKATLTHSGHMVGSAFARFDDGQRSILFSGDLGRPQDLVLRPPEPVPAADYLVVESTYGDRVHPDADPLPGLAAVIKRTAARGGVLVIPAFAVGRAQALIHAIHLLKQRQLIPDLPVFLNSPMAAAATQVYWKYPEELRLTHEECVVACRDVRIVETGAESEALNSLRMPAIIIAASGMATGGRVVHHIKAFAPHERNTLLFVGYQAGGTRGAAIVDGAPRVRIHGEEIPIRAEVARLDDMSAHADANELMAWMKQLGKAPRAAFVTHGEPAAADALRQRIERELRWTCKLPYYLERVALD